MALIEIDVRGVLPLKKQLELLKLGTAKRRRLLSRVGQQVIRDARKRIRTQTDLQGRAFAPGHNPETDTHSHKRGRKMLRGLARMMRVMRNDSLRAEVGFPGFAGQIAARQQHGFEETVTAYTLRQKERSKSTAYYDNPASKQQAKALRDLGFRPRIEGASRRPASLRWITANMTVGQAGAIIKSMRAKQGIGAKTQWVTRIPARSFLGATDAEVRSHINTVFDSLTGEMNRGIR